MNEGEIIPYSGTCTRCGAKLECPSCDSDMPTPAELRIVKILADTGGSNVAIADSLGVSYHTVKVHMGNLSRKCGAKSRTGIVAYAFRNGWVS